MHLCKRMGLAVAGAFFLSVLATGCGASGDNTSVFLSIEDLTGSLSRTDPHILSIYDPNDQNDYRYVQYSPAMSVEFSPVDPGHYMAHAFPISDSSSGNHVEIDVRAGDQVSVTFVYSSASMPIQQCNGWTGTCTTIDAPYGHWSHTVEYR